MLNGERRASGAGAGLVRLSSKAEVDEVPGPVDSRVVDPLATSPTATGHAVDVQLHGVDVGRSPGDTGGVVAARFSIFLSGPSAFLFMKVLYASRAQLQI
jgi:hypothetical protein